MFEQEKIEQIRKFYATYPRYAEITCYRALKSEVGSVDNIFYGDSLTDIWPLHEFFPNHSLLNRGIGGDNAYGLHYRLPEDVLPYKPKRVFLLIGINTIWEPEDRIIAHILALADTIKKRGIDVAISSLLPLRQTDQCDRFEHQEKILRINAVLQAESQRRQNIFLDYHTPLCDETGQLAAEYARPDGLHLTFAAYRRMADVVRHYLVASQKNAHQ